MVNDLRPVDAFIALHESGYDKRVCTYHCWEATMPEQEIKGMKKYSVCMHQFGGIMQTCWNTQNTEFVKEPHSPNTGTDTFYTPQTGRQYRILQSDLCWLWLPRCALGRRSGAAPSSYCPALGCAALPPALSSTPWLQTDSRQTDCYGY